MSFFGEIILSHIPQVFHDTGVINVHPNYYNSTLLDLLVHDGGCRNSYNNVLNNFFTKDTEWAECLWEWRGHRFHRLNVDKASWPNCALKIQGSVPGPTTAKGLGMGTQIWEEKRPTSSLRTTLPLKSKCFKALQNLDFFSKNWRSHLAGFSNFQP